MRIYDISMTIRPDMPVWNEQPELKPKLRTTASHAEGRPHETELTMNMHCGTHLDAPLHMIDSAATIETIPLDDLVGPSRVLDLTGVKEKVTRAELEPFAIQPGEWLLFKTSSSFREQFDPAFVYLAEDGARYLAELGVKGVGTDALGIERAQPGFPTHRTLMAAGVLIVEGLRLQEVAPGAYWFVLAPLKLTGIEAAPARAFLLK